MVVTMNKWQKKAENTLNKLEKGFEKELIRNYQLSLKEIRGILNEMASKYDWTWVEMNKYNRLVRLEEEIGKEIAKLTGKNAQTLLKSMRHLYEESFYSTAWVLTNTVRADLGFMYLNRKLIEKAIENPLDRVGFLQRNRDNQARLTRQLREHLTQSLIQGESYHSTTKRIKERMDVGATNVLRIAQTENHRVRQQAKLDSMEEGAKAGVVLKKMWVSTVDGNTRDTHQQLDGKTINLDEDFKTENGSASAPGMFGIPEEDINCRCTMIEVVAGFEPNQRRVRNVGLAEYATYEEFKKKGLISPK